MTTPTKTIPQFIRQGDVLLVPVSAIPKGCKEVPDEGGRIVLMHGEVTGHAHAIADHVDNADNAAGWAEAGRIAKSAIARASRRARLLEAPDGLRYLEVIAPVTLRHEEHTHHVIPKGLYELPVQMEHTAEDAAERAAERAEQMRMRQVRD